LARSISVGYIEYQTTNDTGAGCGVVSPATGINVCGFRVEKAAAGVWTRLGFKIWGFEQPVAPLVSKM
jgi:hypothetical protein